MDDIDRYAKVEIGKRNLQAENHWEILDLKNLKFEKPTVLCLPGNRAVTHQDANGLAKQVENHLDLLFKTKTGRHTLEQVDIISLKYPLCGEDRGRLTELATCQLADALLALVVDANGKRLDVESAKQKMSRVSFFTFCAGNHELQMILHLCNAAMAQLGYREDEIRAIYSATLEVSFAPLDHVVNYVPSVRVLSQRDDTIGFNHFHMLKAGGVLTKEQEDNLDGIYLHQDTPGKLYGFAHHANNAPSIQIISSNLLNAYSGELPYDYPNEHYISLTARDQDWNLRPFHHGDEAYQSPNADCVSQMMAWALCKGVENSVQNFTAKTYVPNTYWNEMMDDLKSIIKSYDHEKLTISPARATAMHQHEFELRKRQQTAPIPSFETMVNTLNHVNSWEEALAYLQEHNFFGVEYVLPEVQVLTATEKDALLVMAGKKPANTRPDLGIEI